MEANRSEISVPDAAPAADAVRRVGTGVTTLREHDSEEITPIPTRNNDQTRPKSLDEPFKTRYWLSAVRPKLTDLDV